LLAYILDANRYREDLPSGIDNDDDDEEEEEEEGNDDGDDDDDDEDDMPYHLFTHYQLDVYDSHVVPCITIIYVFISHVIYSIYT